MNFSSNTIHFCFPTLFFLPLCLCVYRLVAKPCAHILQIQAGVPRQAQPNAILERLYQSKAVHKARVCSVVYYTSLYTLQQQHDVLALEHTATVIMICSVNTYCHVTGIPIGFVVLQGVESYFMFVLFRVQMKGNWKDSPSSWTGMYGKYRDGFASVGTRTGPAHRKSSVRACT